MQKPNDLPLCVEVVVLVVDLVVDVDELLEEDIYPEKHSVSITGLFT